MGSAVITLLIFMAIMAVWLNADYLLTLIYLLLGVFIFGRVWSHRAMRGVTAGRVFPNRIFFGETISVQLNISNSSFLPLVWLQLHESMPVSLSVDGFLQRVISLPARKNVHYEYLLEGRRRGIYSVGPLSIHSGDPFGLAKTLSSIVPEDRLIVYPKIIQLTRLALPSRSPFGTLRHTQPIFEDPSRVFGKRDYIAGDSLRRVDWKASANAGRMQVKLFEPSIALETTLILNLNSEEYQMRTRIDTSELAIVVAASLANWVTGIRQSVGLITNGQDPNRADGMMASIPARRGRAHLMRILESLASVLLADTQPLVDVLRLEIPHLSWGTTLLVITPSIDDTLFDGLFQARRSGLNVVLIACGPVPHLAEARRRAGHFGIPLYQILNEKDLDIWRQ
jgi:uncharacterized protein (DUF58 family)